MNHRRLFLIPMLLPVLLIIGACVDTEPGAAGEECNFDAEGTDGCDAVSICSSGICHQLCSSPNPASPECGGGACSTFERTFTGEQFTACENPTGGGNTVTTGGVTTGGTTSGDPNCSNNCSSACTGDVPEQACFYCQAACLCRCSGDNVCADENAASACQLGTCGC